MATILNPQPTWQEVLGAGLGSGIQTGVTSLIEHKLKQMANEHQYQQRSKAIQGLQKSGFLGKNVTPEALEQLKYLDPSTFNTILKEQMRQPNQEAFRNATNQQYGIGQAGQQGQAGQVNYEGLKPEQIISLKNSEARQNKVNLAERQFEEQYQEKIISSNKEHRDELNKEVRLADIQNAELDRLEKLLTKGETAQGVTGKLPTVLLGKDSQEFKKIISGIAVRTGIIAKANSDQRMQGVLDSLPDLGTTTEAQKEAVHSWQQIGKIPKLVEEAEEQIIKENKGREVRNLAQKGYQRAKPEIDKVLDSIRQGYQPSQQDPRELAKSDPLSYPQYYKDGTKYQDDNGKIFTLVNGKWS